ncbi:MAG: imidazole glycerol phosphate synthase subunit HisF [Aigarchaeota archaeon]|nr:imidazole glycerol phosphate synthase subunit HisF [Aigarchaeota archaeon]MDW8092188.1 imidazole glycerol phosphate synthase subunit HisF [Nitrososphaerota archaeon]
MPLCKRVIPCLDVDAGRVVKGTSFRNLRDAGDPVELAVRYSEDCADEIVLLDITASTEGRSTIIEVVRRVAEVLDIPFTVGGGIRTKDEAWSVLLNGADKVSLNTAAIQNPQLITEISKNFGDQCVVLAIDAKREIRSGRVIHSVYSHSGTKHTGLDAVQWAKRGEALGAGEILLTSIDMDGTGLGYDLELLRRVSSEVNVPVIASGGVGELKHMYEAITIGGADAVLAASIFHYGKYSVRDVKYYLKERGIGVRL